MLFLFDCLMKRVSMKKLLALAGAIAVAAALGGCCVWPFCGPGAWGPGGGPGGGGGGGFGGGPGGGGGGGPHGAIVVPNANRVA
ncbi:DNA-directed RNA polymerase III 47 kDa polypeptide [Paraburkholderia tropica]|nr:DNA-directed RNA polymerase III 47 kDa polypeptide [Paraburkholderia tropica]